MSVSAPTPAAWTACLSVFERELTPQQFRVLAMIAEGLLNKQIAYELGVSEATVKAHMTAIMRKLGCNNRTQVALAASHLAVDATAIKLPPDGED